MTFRDCVNDNNKMSPNSLKNISPHIHNYRHHLKSGESNFAKPVVKLILLNCLRSLKLSYLLLLNRF